jgi:hypothetical protein
MVFNHRGKYCIVQLTPRREQRLEMRPCLPQFRAKAVSVPNVGALDRQHSHIMLWTHSENARRDGDGNGRYPLAAFFVRAVFFRIHQFENYWDECSQRTSFNLRRAPAYLDQHRLK